MAKEDCIAAAKQALSLFTEGEIKQYAADVFKRAEKYADLSPRAAIRKSIDEIDDERLQSYFEDATIKANNTAKFERLAADIRAGVANFKEIMIRRYKSQATNIVSFKRTARLKLYNSFWGKLSPEEKDFIVSGKNDIEIARALDGKESTPLAKSVAQKHKEYIQERNTGLVESNAMPLDFINKDRNLKAIHDKSRILSGGRSLIDSAKSIYKKGEKYNIPLDRVRKLWKDTIKPLLDIEKTFEGTKALRLSEDGKSSKIDMSIVDKILDGIFDNIVTDKSEIYTQSAVANDREAVKRKSRMFFQWKDQESFMKYNSQYGKGSYASAMISDMNSSSMKIGLARLFGDSPIAMFNDLRHVQQEVSPQSNAFYKRAERYYKVATHDDGTTVSPTFSSVSSTIRSVTAMSRLGGLQIQGLSDIASGIAFGHRWGFNYFNTYARFFKGLYNAIPDSSRSHIAKMCKVNCDSHIGYVGKYLDAVNFDSIMNKATTFFFKWTGTDALDKGNKISSMTMMADELGKLSKTEWNNLRPNTKLQMSKYDINEKEWNLLRNKNQNGLFTTDNVDELTNDELKSLHTDRNSNIPLSELRNDLYTRVYSMFDVASESAYLSPNEFTKSFTTFGTSAGTPEGEFLRFVMQFKGYSISFMDRVLYQGFKDAVGAKAKLGFFVQLSAATLPIAVMSMWLGYLVQGKSLPDWNKMSRGEQIYSSSQLLFPTMNFATSIFNPTNQKSDLIMDAFNGASLKTLSNALAGSMQLLDGNTKQSKKSFEKVAKGILPVSSYPLISPYLNQMFGDKAYLQPGQKQLYGA